MTTINQVHRLSVEACIDNGDYDTEYAKYIMEHCKGDRMIYNGDNLIIAIEDGYLYDDFVAYMVEKLA